MLEHLLGLLQRDERQMVFNDLSNIFNIRLATDSKRSRSSHHNKPMHIEMVKNNFNSIVTALKKSQYKQQVLERQMRSIQTSTM